MPRYEIVAHVTRELECESAEEAAAIVRRQVMSAVKASDTVVHLAVWRQELPPATSPLPAELRQKLDDFFSTLERCATEAEDAFRDRIEAMFTAEQLTPDGQQPSEPQVEGRRPRASRASTS